MAVRPWTVKLDPVYEMDQRDGRNLGGIAVALTDGDDTVEVSRVAFVRRNARNPDADFGEQLDKEIEKAEFAAGAVNEWLDERDRALEERQLEVQDRVRELIGDGEEVPA